MRNAIPILLIMAAFLIADCAPAQADNCNAVSIAAALEADCQYALAASAYMAIVDGFDFVPGTGNTTALLAANKEQKILFGKCAMSCLERGMQEHLTHSSTLADCAEFHLLASSAATMMELEPTNANWTYLRAYALLQQGNVIEADRLLDNCLKLSVNDLATSQKALQAKSQIRFMLAKQ